jgi:hypothetical protein
MFLPIIWAYLSRKKVSKAKDEYNKFMVEQSESLRREEPVIQRQYHKRISNESTGEIRASIPHDMLVFVSYATKDAKLFKIREIAETLTSYNEIKDVLYWQEDMKDNIIEYMDRNLGKCDVMLLFCSPNALKSIPVKKEWTAADSMNIPIIPVFIKAKYIPPLLSSRLGIEFDPFDLQNSIEEIYNLIMKKMS